MDEKTTRAKVALYDAFKQPNPESLKWATTRGGYTTIQAQYQMEKCTQIWGPYGIGWGIRNTAFTWIYDDETPVYVQLECEFFWCDTAWSDGGSFEMTTGWAFQAGDSDVLKKVQTDCISKALSKLGIDSDVFKGFWAALKTDATKTVTYVGPDAVRDVPRAQQDRIDHVLDLLSKLGESPAHVFSQKLEAVKWNYIAVEAIIAKVTKHLQKTGTEDDSDKS